MVLLVGLVTILFILYVPIYTQEKKEEEVIKKLNLDSMFPKVPDTFVDVFKPGLSRKPVLGSALGTCWKRGGVCVEIRHCPTLQMEVEISGCAWGYKVCCRVHGITKGRTVGKFRRDDGAVVITQLEDIEKALLQIAEKNSNRLFNSDTYMNYHYLERE